MDQKAGFNLRELTFLEFIRSFLEYADASGVKSFPLPNDARWHILLWKIKVEFHQKFPDFKSIGEFDWDHVHPKSRSFNDSIFALGYFCTNDLIRRRLYLSKDRGHFVNQLQLNHPELVEAALEAAGGITDFFRD